MKLLTVYTKDDCPQCVKLKGILDSKGIEYTTIKIVPEKTDDDPSTILRDDFIQLFPGVRSVPFTIDENMNKFLTVDSVIKSL